MQRKVSAHAFQKEIAYQKKSEGKCVNNIKTENLVLSEWKHCPNSAQKNQKSPIFLLVLIFTDFALVFNSAQEWKSTSLEKQRW